MMDAEPEITIGIATYNGKKFIERCIDSITNQTFKNIEILISDDNSSDGTPEIIDEISKNHSNIMIFKQKHSLGEFGQKKFLLENSRS